MKISSIFWGILLVLLGGLLMANNLGGWHLFRIERMWPIFVFIPGLLFVGVYFRGHRNPVLLVPGGILTTIGLLFFFETVTDWQLAAYTWPIYPLAVAIGLFQLYLFSGRQRGILIPVFILTTISVVAFTAMFFNLMQQWVNYGILLPILLILAGIILILITTKRRDK